MICYAWCVYGRYFVIANVIVSVYSFLVLFLPKESLLWKFVVVLDLVINYTVLSLYLIYTIKNTFWSVNLFPVLIVFHLVLNFPSFWPFFFELDFITEYWFGTNGLIEKNICNFPNSIRYVASVHTTEFEF